MACSHLPDPAEAATGGFNVRLQYRIDTFTGAEIDVADDRRADTRTGLASFRLRCDRRDEFRLADRAHLFRSMCAICPETLKEHGGNDVVAGIHVGQQLVQIVLVARPIPQVVMRIDDW